MAATQTPQMTAQQQNDMARQILVRNCVDQMQSIFSQTYTTAPGQVINIPLRNVGVVKRYIIEVAATVSTPTGITQTRTILGSSNFFSQVVLTDLSNQTRINTTGWHLTAVSSAKARQPYGSAITATDTPFGYGNNYRKTQTAPATIATTQASNNVFGMFEVPLAYSDTDLRGAIYASVVNATYNLQLTVNPGMFVVSGVDSTSAMYQSSSAVAGNVGTLISYTINVYQNYLDQLPQIPGKGPVLPYLDLGTAYMLNNTALSGFVANQDYPIQYANFRDFLSTTLVFDNGGTASDGTDVNYFALQSANYTNMFKYDPYIASLYARNRLQSDFPQGMYYFDHRNKPINTVQYGNMNLLVNPSTVNANANILVGWEALAIINQVTNAGSLYGN